MMPDKESTVLNPYVNSGTLSVLSAEGIGPHGHAIRVASHGWGQVQLTTAGMPVTRRDTHGIDSPATQVWVTLTPEGLDNLITTLTYYRARAEAGEEANG